MYSKTLVYAAGGAIALAPAVGAYAASATDTSTPVPGTQAGQAAGTTAPSSAPSTATAGSSTDQAGSAATSARQQAPAAPAQPAGPAGSDPTTTTTTAAPPAHAEATALGVDKVLAVGHTTADAGPTSSSGTANALEVGGNPLIAGMTGGSQTSPGSSHGALLDTGSTPLGQLQVTPWSASASNDGNGSTSGSGDAALLRLVGIDPTVLTLSVLQSSSNASYDATGSHGSSSSDGAVADLGNGALTIDLLHAESSSGSTGSSYLVAINGNQIGSSDQANGQCQLNVPSVLSLSCLTATGGAGSATSGAAVGTATLAGGQLPGGVVSGTSSAGATVAAPAATRTAKSPPTKVEGEKVPSTGSLPFTGSQSLPMIAAGLIAAGFGALLQRVRRRGAGAGALS